MNKKGITKIELTCVIIMIAVFIAIMIPLGYNFVEGQRRSKDRIKAGNAQDTARQEFMLTHFTDDPIIYSFSGKSEVLLITAHAYVGEDVEDYSNLTPPKKDGFNDGGSRSSTTLTPTASSDKVGDTPLYIIVGNEGEILYNSWMAALSAK